MNHRWPKLSLETACCVLSWPMTGGSCGGVNCGGVGGSGGLVLVMLALLWLWWWCWCCR